MNFLLFALGAFLLALTILDLMWTTLWVDGGAGPVSSRLATGMWRGLRGLGGSRSRILGLAGPLILAATLLLWVAMIWAGWTFLFASDGEALIDTNEDEPVTWTGRIYFVAYSMFTMGNGDFRPRDGFWQIATALTTASGMLFVTMGVSYIISVLSSVAAKRALAGSITGLGTRGEEVVEAGWDGKSLHFLDQPLNSIAPQLSLLAQQHEAYPILHYYHSEAPREASAVAVAVLDEALTLILLAIPEDCQPNRAVVKAARASVDSYLNTLHTAFIEPADHAPTTPDLALLRAIGIPTVSDEAFSEALAAVADRRRKLLGMVRKDAWDWLPDYSSTQL